MKGNLPGSGQNYKIRQASDGGGGVEIIDSAGKRVHYAPSRKTAQEWVDEQGSQPVFYIDIPPSLRNTATGKGFPLFAKGGYMLQPVDYDPFKEQ